MAKLLIATVLYQTAFTKITVVMILYYSSAAACLPVLRLRFHGASPPPLATTAGWPGAVRSLVVCLQSSINVLVRSGLHFRLSLISRTGKIGSVVNLPSVWLIIPTMPGSGLGPISILGQLASV